MRSSVIAFIISLLCGGIAVAGHPTPDGRFKCDVLLVIAHPDDETAIGGFLAQLVYDEKKKVAVVYCTRGTGGGNSFGIEQSTSMGLIREIEGRRALSAFGIDNVWFVGGADTPSQDVFRSLGNWNHGAVLEEVVRIIRLTRPEVILTWLPAFVAGENHGDHQASGVIATEAFGVAADPTAYPSQVVNPREKADINNSTEGLAPWQTKKIYYFSDANHPVDLPGPSFDLTAVSPSRNLAYYRIAAELHKPHRTQGDVSEIAFESAKTNDFRSFIEWLKGFRLLFGKSVFPCSSSGGLFEGIRTGDRVAPALAEPWTPPPTKLLRLGGPFSFYEQFYRKHQITHIEEALNPELEVGVGSYVHVPLILSNQGSDSVVVRLSSSYPSGWKPVSRDDSYAIPGRGTLFVETFFFAPDKPEERSGKIVWMAQVRNGRSESVTLEVRTREWALPQ